MGEIADMMLDGTLCQGCGGYIGSDNGFPTWCSDCKKERKQYFKNRQIAKNKKERECGKQQ